MCFVDGRKDWPLSAHPQIRQCTIQPRKRVATLGSICQRKHVGLEALGTLGINPL